MTEHADPSVNCAAVAARIHEFIDGEVEPPVAERIAAHILDCDNCQDELAVWEVIRRQLRTSHPLMHAPESLLASIKAIIADVQTTETVAEAV